MPAQFFRGKYVYKGDGEGSDCFGYDDVVASAEKIAVMLVELLRNNGLIKGEDSYLELYVDEIYRSL